MNHRTGLARNQTLRFAESLEDYVSADNPVPFLDAFVQKLDLHALGFSKAKVAETGRPPYDPADLLKLYLYGYLHRIRSSRRLEQETRRNGELIWLFAPIARSDLLQAFLTTPQNQTNRIQLNPLRLRQI